MSEFPLPRPCGSPTGRCAGFVRDSGGCSARLRCVSPWGQFQDLPGLQVSSTASSCKKPRGTNTAQEAAIITPRPESSGVFIQRRRSARKSDAQSTKHKAQSTKHKAQSTKHEEPLTHLSLSPLGLSRAPQPHPTLVVGSTPFYAASGWSRTSLQRAGHAPSLQRQWPTTRLVWPGRRYATGAMPTALELPRDQ